MLFRHLQCQKTIILDFEAICIEIRQVVLLAHSQTFGGLNLFTEQGIMKMKIKLS